MYYLAGMPFISKVILNVEKTDICLQGDSRIYFKGYRLSVPILKSTLGLFAKVHSPAKVCVNFIIYYEL